MVQALLQHGANVNAADNDVCVRERESEREKERQRGRQPSTQEKIRKVPLNNAVFLMRHASRAKAISIRFGLEETDERRLRVLLTNSTA